jgi:RNA polymerase sigma factor (sigma-70 family)
LGGALLLAGARPSGQGGLRGAVPALCARVKAFLMKSGAGAALAEECAQDVMATLWQKAHLFDPARAGVATWVYTIARNRRIDALRKSRAGPSRRNWTGDPRGEPDQAEVL